MEHNNKQKESENYSIPRLILYSFALFLSARWLRGGRPEPGEKTEESEREFERSVFHGWLIVCGMSIAFVLYGIFAFFVIGDKGPPGWDFGGVQDIPGGSEYSTHPFRDVTAEAEPQHVNQKPSQAAPDLTGPPPTPGKLFEGAEHEGPGRGAMRGEYGPGT